MTNNPIPSFTFSIAEVRHEVWHKGKRLGSYLNIKLAEKRMPRNACIKTVIKKERIY